MADCHTFTEELKISADKLKDTIESLVHEGNVRHIIVKHPDGHVIMEVPVTVGIAGILIAPVLAAIAAVAVYAADFTIVVTREQAVDDRGMPPPPPPTTPTA